MKLTSYLKWSLVTMLVAAMAVAAPMGNGIPGTINSPSANPGLVQTQTKNIQGTEVQAKKIENTSFGGAVLVSDLATKQDVQSVSTKLGDYAKGMVGKKDLLDLQASILKSFNEHSQKTDGNVGKIAKGIQAINDKTVAIGSGSGPKPNWMQRWGIVIVIALVILGLVPAIMACCLVLRSNRILGDSLKELKASLPESGTATNDADALQKTLAGRLEEFKKGVVDAIAIRMQSVQKKSTAPDEGLVAIKSTLDTLKKSLDSVLIKVATAEGAQNSVLKQVAGQKSAFDALTRDFKAESDLLLGNLKEQVITLEKRSAELAGKEKTIQIREDTLDARVNGAVAAAQKDAQARIQDLTTALEKISELGVQKRLDEQKAAMEVQKQREAEALATHYQQEVERLVTEAVAQKETELTQTREALKQIQDGTARQLAIKENECKSRLDDKDRLLFAEKTAHEQTKTALSTAAQKLAVETANFERARTELVEMQAQNAELSKRMYPTEVLEKPGFAELQAKLDAWSTKGYVGADIARSALGMFAARRSVSGDTWMLALRDISSGVAQALREAGVDAVSAVAELTKWSQFMSAFSDASQDDPYYFQLSVPRVGDMVDSSWMKQINATSVSMVNSWAVYTAMGLRYQADIA